MKTLLMAIDNSPVAEKVIALTIEQALAHQPYLSGDAFGFGDIPLGSFAYAWFEMPIARRSRPNMERWYQQLRARPAYQRGVMSELT